MLYIESQNGLRIADLRTVSIVTPEHDRDGDEVYKIFINGIEFARYSTKEQTEEVMASIKRFIRHSGSNNACMKLPQDKSE